MSRYDLSTTYETAGLSGPGSDADRLAGVVSHGSMLFAMPLVVPVIVLLLAPMFSNARYVRGTAIQALLFQLVITLGGGLLLGIAGVFFSAAWIVGAIPLLGLLFGPLTALIGWPVAAVLGLAGLVVAVWGLWIELVATWKAFKGEPYRMPIVGGFGV